MSDFDIVEAINSGYVSAYRKKTCQWCGATVEEKLVSFKENKPYYPVFAQSGFGTVCIVPHEIPTVRMRDISLCPQCAAELDEFLDSKEEMQREYPKVLTAENGYRGTRDADD